MSLRWRRFQERKKKSRKGEICIFEGCEEKPVFTCPICGVHTCERHRPYHMSKHGQY